MPPLVAAEGSLADALSADVTPARITHRHLKLGAAMLELIGDWDAWVHRRVDSLSFAGEDETVIERRHSVDFCVPADAAHRLSTLSETAKAVPLPITFFNKWRLPHFSVEDEGGRALSMLPRRAQGALAAGMLAALASLTVTGELCPPSAMPTDLLDLLCAIAIQEPRIAVALCDRISPFEAVGLSAESARWRRTLVLDEAFMELAYELAHGCPLIVMCPTPVTEHRVLKLSYDWPIAHPLRFRWFGRLRTVRLRWPVGDRWPRRALRRSESDTGQLALTSVCRMLTLGPRGSGTDVACATVRIKPPVGPVRNFDLRPNAVRLLERLPAGRYELEFRPGEGFGIDLPRRRAVRVDGGRMAHAQVRVRQDAVGAKPSIVRRWRTRPPSFQQILRREIALRSKPMMVRLRLGDGGSRHVEFEAPEGMLVTRAKLVADRLGSPDQHEGELDIVLEGRQRAHLYTPAGAARSETGYTFLNLRPRVETLPRPAMWTAIIASVALASVAIPWEIDNRISTGGVAVVFGAPGLLAAYFAQAIPSRVTNAMLYGLRLVAIMPAILGLLAAATILMGRRSGWGLPAMWSLVGVSALLSLLLVAIRQVVAYPPEQRWNDWAQGDEFVARYSKRLGAGSPPPPEPAAPGPAPEGETGATAVRDRLIARAGGLTRETRRLLLNQRRLLFRAGTEVPPALYFDAAESVPIFRGLPAAALASLRGQLRMRALYSADMRRLDSLVRDEASTS